MISPSALLLALALSQGYASAPPGATGGGKVLASFPLTTSGPLITEDSNTVAHVYWNGTALVDSKGNAWTQNGTVPQVTANPFTTTRYGAGPFSTSNYYSLGTGADVLDFAGDFTVCVAFQSPTIAGASHIVSNGTYGAAGAGYLVRTTTSATSVVTINFEGAESADKVATTGNPYTTGPNVLCAGRSGTTGYIKLNLGTTASVVSVPIEAGSAYPAIIGNGTYAPSGAFALGTIYEVYATSTPFTEATVVAIQQKVLGHFDGSSALAVTRATTATYAPRAADPSTLFTVPAGVARITDEGLLVEPARTNVVLASNTISSANAFNVNWVAWPDETTVDVTTSAVAAPGGGTWHTITNEAGAGSNVGQAYQTVTTASSTTFVASAWMKKPAAEDTTHAGIHVGCGAGTPTACTCVRSDGGTCTASTVATNYCQALVADLSTTPVRVAAKVTCSGAITSSIVALVPGNYGSTIGITDFTGVQHEIGTFPTSLVVTTTTAATRNADQVSAAVPFNVSPWCIAETVNFHAVNNASFFAAPYDTNGANRAFLTSSGGQMYAIIGDAAAGLKYPSAANPSWTSGVSKRLTTCFGLATVPSLRVDGVLISSGTNGTGTGMWGTPATTLYFGSSTSNATQLGGYLKNVKVCSGKTPAQALKVCP